jgi:hypothetical protein
MRLERFDFAGSEDERGRSATVYDSTGGFSLLVDTSHPGKIRGESRLEAYLGDLDHGSNRRDSLDSNGSREPKSSRYRDRWTS